MKKAYTYTALSVMLVFSVSLAAQDTESDFIKVSERKDWGFSISPYAILGADGGTDLLDVEFSLNQLIIDTRLGYLFYDDIHYKEDEVGADIGGFGFGNSSNLSWEPG
jgi:hypothetical protein